MEEEEDGAGGKEEDEGMEEVKDVSIMMMRER